MKEYNPIAGPFTIVVAPDLSGPGWIWRVFVPNVMDLDELHAAIMVAA